MNTKINIKFFIIIALVLVMLFLSSTFSFAKEDYSIFIALKSNSTLNKGEIITVDVALTNINAGNGIDVITAELNYDNNVFETLTINDFKSNTGWRISYAPSTNMLTAIRDNKITQNQIIFTINLKVKSITNVDSTTITLNKITASGGLISDGGTDDISISNASINIKKTVQEVLIPNYSVGMNLTSNDSLKTGEIVSVYANLTNINAGNGIDVITAKLSYDNNVFEVLTSDDYSSNTGWRISYAPSTNMLTAIRDNKVTQNQTVFIIKLKLKSELNVDNTTISLDNIVVSGGRLVDGGTDDISVNTANITLNRALEVVSNLTDIIKPIASTSKPSISKSVSTSSKKQNSSTDIDVTSEQIINSNVISNSDEAITETTEVTDVTEVKKDIKVAEKIKITDTKVTDSDVFITQRQNKNSDKVQNAIVGSASSISFVSICFVLFRKLKFGI